MTVCPADTGRKPAPYFWQTGQKKVDLPDWMARRTIAPLRPQGHGLPSRPYTRQLCWK